MQRELAALTLLLLLGMVLGRSLLMKRRGIKAIYFGNIDKKDFLIPPFAVFYFYIVFAAAFGFPTIAKHQIFHSIAISSAGVCFCLAGLVLVVLTLVSFGRSFRVGIDTDHPDKLVTSGVFAFSRNPIYLAFWLVLFGEFLVFSNPILLIYFLVSIWLIHRQVLREEDFLRQHYGREYLEYRGLVRRYI
jgi:protein-S-isoprenylcysteine O-methyltransferase Ste14